jgi:hypothetical protein
MIARVLKSLSLSGGHSNVRGMGKKTMFVEIQSVSLPLTNQLFVYDSSPLIERCLATDDRITNFQGAIGNCWKNKRTTRKTISENQMRHIIHEEMNKPR